MYLSQGSKCSECFSKLSCFCFGFGFSSSSCCWCLWLLPGRCSVYRLFGANCACRCRPSCAPPSMLAATCPMPHDRLCGPCPKYTHHSSNTLLWVSEFQIACVSVLEVDVEVDVEVGCVLPGLACGLWPACWLCSLLLASGHLIYMRSMFFAPGSENLKLFVLLGTNLRAVCLWKMESDKLRYQQLAKWKLWAWIEYYFHLFIIETNSLWHNSS